MLPFDDCGITDDVCCTALFDTADWLLQQVYPVVSACVATSECIPPLLAYVTLGVGDDGVRDALTVAVGATAPSQVSLDGVGRQVGFSLYRTTYRVQLRESGWPMAQVLGGDIHAPDPVLQNTLARHAYAHGEQMYRKLEQMRLARTLTPTTLPRPSVALLGPLVPLQPQGGVVGFYADVQVDMQWKAPT